MKWYFALNDRSKDYAYLAKAAVRSAAANTSLIPHCLYDGEPDELTSWFERHGVKVIHHRVSFFAALQAHYPPDRLKIAAGAFLRCDIPILEKEDEYVLYTDCDVIFLQEVAAADLPKPEFCACSTEQKVDDWSYFNTGSMVMNTRRLREDHDNFSSFIQRRLPVLHTFDQDAFNIFYGKRIEKLDPIYNWKPYWGRSDNARILHFHGPKPRHVNALLRDEKIEPIYRSLFYLDPIGFRHALEMFASFDKDFTPHFEGYSQVVLPEVVRMNKEYQKPPVSIILKKLRRKVARTFHAGIEEVNTATSAIMRRVMGLVRGFTYSCRSRPIAARARRNSRLTKAAIKEGDLLQEKVCIVVPVGGSAYNGRYFGRFKRLLARYLPAQVHQNYEVLVMADSENHEMREWVARLDDGRITYTEWPDLTPAWGHPQTREAIRICQADYFVRMNCDNEPFENYLHELVQGFDEDIDFVYGRVLFSGPAVRTHRLVLAGDWQPRNELKAFVIPRDHNGTLLHSNVDCMNFMIRVARARELRAYWSDAFCADWHFIEEGLRRGMRCRFVDKVLGLKR